MRTDRSRERTEEAAEACGPEPIGSKSDRTAAVVSRRSVLLSGGLLAGAALPGVGSADAEPDARHVVTATAPYLERVRDSFANEQVTDGGGHLATDAVELREADGGVQNPLADGDVALHVAGRPVLDVGGDGALETTGADGERGPTVADAVVASGLAALTHTDGEWRDCLPRAAVREEWAGAEPVETWSEVPDASADGLGDPETVADETDAAQTGSSDGDAASEATQIVRGTRSAQYAKGCGGESYYAADSHEFESMPAEEAALEGSTTPVARLAYVYVADGARVDESVGTVLDQLRAHGSAEGGPGLPFVDPAFEKG